MTKTKNIYKEFVLFYIYIINKQFCYIYRLSLQAKWSQTHKCRHYLSLRFIIFTPLHRPQMRMIRLLLERHKGIRNLKTNSAKISSIRDTADTTISVSSHMGFKSWDRASALIWSTKPNNVNLISSGAAVNMVNDATFCTGESNHLLKRDLNKNNLCKISPLYLSNKVSYLKVLKKSEEFHLLFP